MNVDIYTDGACSGNPGPGGWAAVIILGERKLKVSGGERHTTNNRMELLAIIKALKAISKLINNGQKIKRVRIISDSSYVVNSVNNGYLQKWAVNGWKTTRGTDVINRDLWEELSKLIKAIRPKFIKVKGHSGDKFNEIADKLAVEESNKFK